MERAPQDPRHPKANDRCSLAGYRFMRRQFEIFDHFFFNLRLATTADHVRFTAAKALADAGGSTEVSNWEEVQKDPKPMFRKLRSFGTYNAEVMTSQAADNFLCMLSETLQACMLKRPELLKSSDQIRTEDVLRFTKRRELVDFLVNRKINELSYGGLRGIEEICS